MDFMFISVVRFSFCKAKYIEIAKQLYRNCEAVISNLRSKYIECEAHLKKQDVGLFRIAK